MSGGPATRREKIAFVDPAKFTPHFSWKKTGGNSSAGESVFCEGVSLDEIADAAGTPAYVYSRAAIGDAYKELVAGLGALPHTLCFAVKSNGNLAILKYLAGLGGGFDIVSGGELQHLQRIGVPGKRIVFSGVGKTREEMREALRYRSARRGGTAGILLFSWRAASRPFKSGILISNTITSGFRRGAASNSACPLDTVPTISHLGLSILQKASTSIV